MSEAAAEPNLLAACPVLAEMIMSGSAPAADGTAVAMHSFIPQPYAEALHRLVLQERPDFVVEIGMAFGVSTLAILSALDRLGGAGRLLSIDPLQARSFYGCGLAAVKRAGLDQRHELIEAFDYEALPRLLSSGQTLDMAYIDGWHTFDYVLLDWWYIDRMLRGGGVVGFNDCGWPAVDKAIKFVMSHRRYAELDVGLPLEAADYSRAKGLKRRLLRRDVRSSYRQAQDRYFRKLGAWEPSWDFYVEF